MLLAILMFVFGIIALGKGEFKITGSRKVTGSTGRSLGIALLLGSAAFLIPGYGGLIQITLLIVVIAVGLVRAEKIEPIEAVSKSET